MTLKNKLFWIGSGKARRGLAGIVTSAILLAAVSIMGVMLLAWSNTSLATQQQAIEETFSTQMNKINEDLSFENIWFPTPSGGWTENHVNMTLTNIGILGLNVTTIQITNVTGTNNTLAFDSDYTNLGIVKSGTISLNVTYPWDSGDELDVLIFTNRGNQFITQVVVP
jgi:hypothetical protein